jgi:S1-C subfamily serine protease
VRSGALVESVQKGTPAEKAGIKGGVAGTTEGQSLAVGGDIIVSIDGKKVNSSQDVASFIHEKKPGQTITVGLKRPNGSGGYKNISVTVTLGSRPDKLEGATTPEG